MSRSLKFEVRPESNHSKTGTSINANDGKRALRLLQTLNEPKCITLQRDATRRSINTRD
jgi:hypothetical protein